MFQPVHELQGEAREPHEVEDFCEWMGIQLEVSGDRLLFWAKRLDRKRLLLTWNERTGRWTIDEGKSASPNWRLRKHSCRGGTCKDAWEAAELAEKECAACRKQRQKGALPALKYKAAREWLVKGELDFLRVDPTCRTARAAVAWTFGQEEAVYSPAVQT